MALPLSKSKATRASHTCRLGLEHAKRDWLLITGAVATAWRAVAGPMGGWPLDCYFAVGVRALHVFTLGESFGSASGADLLARLGSQASQ